MWRELFTRAMPRSQIASKQLAPHLPQFMTLIQGLLLFGAAVMAGMINSVAGGGTLVTFPALIWAGRPEIIANATSTFALVPGAWSSAYGYRGELLKAPRKF